MVAYSYQPQFIEPTWSGRKVHTIRATGLRRHARPGEALQHYTGMRTKACKLFARSTCLKTLPIDIFFGRRPSADWVMIDRSTVIDRPAQRDDFAQHDGFECWAAMRVFWSRHHGELRTFAGVIVYWKDMEPIR